MIDQSARLDEIKSALEVFFIQMKLDMDKVMKIDLDGFKSYAITLGETTCILRFYHYDLNESENYCVWFDSAIGVVSDEQLAKAVSRTALAINDHVHSFRVRTESLGHGQNLLTILFRSNIEHVPPSYAVEVVAAAAELGTDLREILCIQTIRRSKAS